MRTGGMVKREGLFLSNDLFTVLAPGGFDSLGTFALTPDSTRKQGKQGKYDTVHFLCGDTPAHVETCCAVDCFEAGGCRSFTGSKMNKLMLHASQVC